MQIFISRFGHDEIELEVPSGTTVAAVLQMSGIDLDGRQEVYVSGVRATPGSIVEDGDILSVVTPKQAG